MAINNFSRSDLNKIHFVVQNAAIIHPKEMVIALLRDFFAADSMYGLRTDAWGFPKVVDVTDLPLDAGMTDNSTTRIAISESYNFNSQFFPSIIVRHGGSRYVPISFNRELASVAYEDVAYQDGYGNLAVFKRPKNFIFAGAWEGSLTLDVRARDLKSRDDIVELVCLFFADIGSQQLVKAGVLIKEVSFGAAAEQDDRNDKIFTQQVTLSIRSEWRREPPIGNLIDIINFAIEFGAVDDPDYPISPNLTVKTVLGLLDSVKDI